MKIKIPIRTVSEANNHDHWAKKSHRHKNQKAVTKLFLAPMLDETCLPCILKITRVAPRKLDKAENMPMSLKYIIDAVCELLVPGKAVGQADSDPRITIQCDQRRGELNEYAVEVEIIKTCIE